MPDARPGPVQGTGGALPDARPITTPMPDAGTGPEAAPDALPQSTPGPDAGTSPDAGGTVTMPDAMAPDAHPATSCPNLPPVSAPGPVTNCAPGQCAPNGFNASATCEAACGVSLFNGDAFRSASGTGPKSALVLLPPAASCPGNDWTGTLTIAVTGESGCARAITSPGRYLNNPGTSCAVTTFLASVANPGTFRWTVHAPAGAPLGWTVLETAELEAGVCPLSCP